MHHVSIRTRDIFQALAFYERLGYVVEERFTTGSTLACWLTGYGGRLELIQIPEPKPAPDAWLDEHYTGYYHLSLEVKQLDQLLAQLQREGVTILLEPRDQTIGTRRFRVAFICDCDGLPVEFLEAL